ncbi:MAG: NADPH-dependent FMN reductase [Bacteroidia bacterium]
MAIHIIGIGGSTAQTCTSSWALQHALKSAEAAGATTEEFLIRDLEIPMYVHEPDATPPADAQALADAIARADGLIWSSPLYQGTVSGAFKNVIDWFQLTASNNPPYLTNKVVGLICAAGGTHGLQAINTMEYMVHALRGWAVPLVAPLSRASKLFDEQGNITDPATALLLKGLGAEVVKGATAFHTER